jgi:hypothetical protein
MRTYFLHLGSRKKWISWSYVLNKKLPWELKFCLLHFLKDDFDEVDEAMYQVNDGSFELIFYIPEIEKSDFHNLLKWYLGYVLNRRMSWQLIICLLPSEKLSAFWTY